MRSRIILVIAFSIGLFGSNLSAQYDTSKIDMHLLKGVWEANDPVKHRVEFADSLFQVVLLNRSAEHPYYFPMDSLKRVSAMGYYPNWPPFDCHLKIIAPEILEISYSQMGTLHLRKKYFKVNN